MTTKLEYYLDDLWDFTDKQILQILKHFKVKPSDPITNRLEAIILSYNNYLLMKSDIPYVESDRFDDLLLSSNEQLKILSEELGYNGNYNHIDMIKFIIDNDINIVDNLPSQIKDKIEIYQMNKDLYVCGVGTFNIRDKLKSMNGRWDPKNKCWILPLIVKSNLISLIRKETEKAPKKSDPKSTIIDTSENPKVISQIHPNIPIVNQIPNKILHELQVYQIDNNILLCGKNTYDLKNDLKSMGSEFNGRHKCWNIPRDRIDYVLDLVNENKEKDTLKKEKIQLQRTLTRLENLEAKNLLKKEQLNVQKRLDKEELELPYVTHYNRLSKDELDLLRRDYSYGEIMDMVEELDVKELKKIWDDKIKIVDYKNPNKSLGKYPLGNYKYVTYIGDYKPPNKVLEYWSNNWLTVPIGSSGFSIKRVDYKIYEIYKFSTD